MSVHVHTADTPQLRLDVWWETSSTGTNPLSRLFSPTPDIDSGMLLIREDGVVVDESYYGQLRTQDGSIQHHGGDNIDAPLVYEAGKHQDQYDIALDTVNNVVSELHVGIFGDSMGLNDPKRKMERLTYTLSYPYEEGRIVLAEGELDTVPEANGVHIASLIREGKHGWVFSSVLAPVQSKNVRDFHQVFFPPDTSA